MIIEARKIASIETDKAPVSDIGDNDDDYTDDQHQTSLDLNAVTIDTPVDLTLV